MTQETVYKQSGVIAYRGRPGDDTGQLEVLLITSRSRKRWVIPKGLVEFHLSPRQSAIEEAYEEAGIEGEVSPEAVGRFSYEKWAGLCQVEVFVMRVDNMLDDWPEAYFRTRRWFSVEEAAGKVREAELAELIRSLPRLLGNE
ncbi:NUDIX hydrolase [Candidatus Sumerlaeota bacterium]